MRRLLVGISFTVSIGIVGILLVGNWEGLSSTKGLEQPVKTLSPIETVYASVEKEVVNPLDITNKEEVKERLLNTYHFYDKVQGSFHYFSNDVGFDYTIDYKLKWKEKKVQYQVKVVENNKQLIDEISYLDGQMVFLYHGAKTYETLEYPIEDKGEFKKVKDTYITNKDGSKEYYYPEINLNLGLAENSLYPKEIAVGFLEDYNSWNITDVENFLGRETVVIDGKLDAFYQEKLKSNRFKLWMDKNTGILLKYETYSSEGQIVDGLETTAFKINGDFSVEDKSKKIPSNYKKFDPNFSNDNYSTN